MDESHCDRPRSRLVLVQHRPQVQLLQGATSIAHERQRRPLCPADMGEFEVLGGGQGELKDRQDLCGGVLFPARQSGRCVLRECATTDCGTGGSGE